MAKIVCISKYPPLVGGIAAKTYWLMKALAERGHEVHVVTDANDAAPEYSVASYKRPEPQPNVSIHRPYVEIPWHVPDDRHRSLSLLDKAVQVISDLQPDIIDTGYLVPYGIVGYLANRITGVPFVLRHGGSDIAKFLSQNIWPMLFKKMFDASSLTVTDQAHKDTISRLTSKLTTIPPYVPDPALFNSSGRSTDGLPTLAIIGKANYNWRHKGWHRVAEIVKALGRDFRYLVVSQGKGLADFTGFMTEPPLADVIEWEPFLPPWAMPSLLRRIDALFAFESDIPFPAFSNLVLEALCSKITVITNSLHLAEQYETEGLNLQTLPGTILPINVNNPSLAAKQITAHFETISALEFHFTPSAKDHEQYIAANEKALIAAANANLE